MTTKTRNLLLLLLLACCWGPSFLFIKLALISFSPLTLVNTRLILAALVLYIMLRFRGDKLKPYMHYFFDFFFMAVFSCALPFSLISMGEQYISSSLAAIVNSTVPIFTVVLAHFFINDEKLKSTKIFGILLSFCGVLLVFLPSALDQLISDDIGIFCVFLASISYAVSITYARRSLREVPFLVSATAQLIIASIILAPFTILIENPNFESFPSYSSLIGLVGLAIFGTAIAFNTYYKLVQSAAASYVATSTLLFPIIGIALGAIVLGERLAWNAYGGSIIILMGLMVTNRLVDPALIFRKLKKL